MAKIKLIEYTYIMEVKKVRTFWHRIQTEKSMAEISSKFNSDNIIRNNNNINVYQGEWIKLNVNDYSTHIVRPMQTLNQIAEIAAVPKEKLMKDNNLESEKVFIGQRLKIYK